MTSGLWPLPALSFSASKVGSGTSDLGGVGLRPKKGPQAQLLSIFRSCSKDLSKLGSGDCPRAPKLPVGGPHLSSGGLAHWCSAEGPGQGG